MLTPSSASTVLRLPTFFSDGMVVQCGAILPIWGWAAPDENVTIRLAGQSRTVRADHSGRWMVRLEPLAATFPGDPTLVLDVVTCNERLMIRETVAGEVWLCSGQSNMEFDISGVANAADVIDSANHPHIREFRVPRIGSPEPQDSSFLAPSRWQPTTPQTVGKFTAVGYFFALEISRALNGIPVGLINSAWGGTTIQSWMPLEALRSKPSRYEQLLEAKEKELAEWPARLHQIEADTRAWEERVAAARAAGQTKLPNMPWNPGPPDLPQWMPANLYNGMIAPLAPCALRGMLWYQGESNADLGREGASEYTSLQTEMIHRWRTVWEQGEFPFCYVQLTSWRGGDPAGTSRAWFREGQEKALAVPNTGMAVTIDLGESDTNHPTNKQPVGDRLARIALRHTYGLLVADEGPIYREMSVEQTGSVHLRFDGAESGLAARDGTLRQFQVAGEDRRFYPAQAVIENDCVIVSCAQVPRPAAVRYAWANDPVGCNLYGGNGLPAAPFRTDDW